MDDVCKDEQAAAEPTNDPHTVTVKSSPGGGRTTADVYRVGPRWHWQYVAWAPNGLGTEVWSSDVEGAYVGEPTAEAAGRAAVAHFADVLAERFGDWRAGMPEGGFATPPWMKSGEQHGQGEAPSDLRTRTQRSADPRKEAHRRQLAALTRAQRQGPAAVIGACLKAVEAFEANGWPDDWPTWAIAFQDSMHDARRAGASLL